MTSPSEPVCREWLGPDLGECGKPAVGRVWLPTGKGSSVGGGYAKCARHLRKFQRYMDRTGFRYSVEALA